MKDRDLSDLAFASEMIIKAQPNKKSDLIGKLEKEVFDKNHEFRTALKGITVIQKRRRSKKEKNVATLIDELMKKKSTTSKIVGQTLRWSDQNLKSQILRKQKFPEVPDSKPQK